MQAKLFILPMEELKMIEKQAVLSAMVTAYPQTHQTGQVK